MDFCTEDQHQEFLRTCPEGERRLVRPGIVLLKYWLSTSYEEHRLYTRYSMAKDTTFQFTDIKQAPWYVVPSDDKRRARLNCISHILSQIPYEDVVPEPIEIPQREDAAYIRPPMREQTFVPQLY